MNRATTAALSGLLLLAVAAAPAPAQAAAATTGSLAGRILTNGGVPVAGAYVGVDVPRNLMTTVTDANGNFQLDGVTPGSYHVFAQRQTIGAPRQWVPRKTVEADSSPVSFVAGQVTKLDETLLPLGLITGTFSGPGGPIGNAFVQPDGNSNSEAVTDADGSYALYVWPGDHTLFFDPFTSDEEQWATATRNKADATVFSIAEDQVLQHDEKQMADGMLAGRVLDYTGAALSGATVELVDSHGVTTVTTTTGLAGNWSAAAFPDDYQIRYQYGNRWQQLTGVFTVLPGQTTAVPDEKLVQPGDIQLGLTVGGKAAQSFCLTLVDDTLRKSVSQCTENGTVVFSAVTPATYSVDITVSASYWSQTRAVTAVAGQVVKATLTVTG